MASASTLQQEIADVSAENNSVAIVGNVAANRDVNINWAATANPRDAIQNATKECLDALYLTNPEDDREVLCSAKGTRVAGTCEWISEHKTYNEWLHGNTSYLWISGGPGKGKTMMSIYLTETIPQTFQGRKDEHLLYYFCRHQDEKCNTAITILRSLIHQIVSKCPELVKHALPRFDSPVKRQDTLSSLDALWVIFKALVTDPGLCTILCLIDGLDECDEKSQHLLLQKFWNYFYPPDASSESNRFRLAIVSREIVYLNKCPNIIKLDPDNQKMIASDIGRFVSDRVMELTKSIPYDNDSQDSHNYHPEQYVYAKLLQKSGGTFLWVGMVMNILLRLVTWTEVIQELQDLPEGLSEIYSRMLRDIPSGNKETTSRILRWVTLALRPLNIKEIASAVDFQPMSGPISDKVQMKEAIVRCGQILKIHDDYVYFVHNSAQEYMLRTEHHSGEGLEWARIQTTDGHLELTQRCLALISQSFHENWDDDISVSDSTFHKLPAPGLLTYAIFDWPSHAKRCLSLVKIIVDQYESFFAPESIPRTHWWKIYYRLPQETDSSQPLLHVLCYLGIFPLIEATLVRESMGYRVDSGVDRTINKQDVRGNTALHIAVSRNNHAAVRLLIGYGADSNIQNKNGRTALHEASVRDTKMTQLLVDRGAELDIQNMNGQTALHLTTSVRNLTRMNILLNHGADPNTRDRNGITVLRSIIDNRLGNSEEVMQQLIERGVDLKIIDGEKNSLLHVQPHLSEKVIRQAVGLGLDINGKNANGETPLHIAAWVCSQGVPLLVELGADIHAQDRSGQTPFDRACARNSAKISDLFVNKRADPTNIDVLNKRSPYGQTTLHDSAKYGRNHAVEFFINSKVDLEVKNFHGLTALQEVVLRHGRIEIIKLLVEGGANMEVENQYGRTVLSRAASLGMTENVRLLLGLGADLGAKDKKGQTALQIAIGKGHRDIVSIIEEWKKSHDMNDEDRRSEDGLEDLCAIFEAF